MTFTITHVSGAMRSDPPVSALPDLIAELGAADDEHPDVAVSHESGWTLSAYRGGRIVFENVEDDDVEPGHLVNISADEALTMFERLAAGDLAWIEALPWIRGY